VSQSNVVPLRRPWDPFAPPPDKPDHPVKTRHGRPPKPDAAPEFLPRKKAVRGTGRRRTQNRTPSGGLLKRQEAAAYLGVSPSTLDKLIGLGELVYWQPPKGSQAALMLGRLKRIRKDHLEALIRRWSEEGKGTP